MSAASNTSTANAAAVTRHAPAHTPVHIPAHGHSHSLHCPGPDEAWRELLQRVRDALLPHGRLLLRIGDSANRRGFVASQWVDRIVTTARGQRVPPTFCRPLAGWVALLEGLGFIVHSVPMSRGTPFANVLLSADLK